MVEISGVQTTGATVPGDHCAQLQTLATSRHRVTCHAARTRANTNTFMQLLTAANHSILQGFKNVVTLQYTQQPAVSSMATITYTADQLLADIPGYGNYCDAQKNAFYLRSLCLSGPGVCASGGDAPCGDVSIQTGRAASGFKYLQKCLQVFTY